MNNRKISQQQQFLPLNLLEDDDRPTSTSLKHEYDDKRSIAFSAPPILFDIGFDLEEDWRDLQKVNLPQFTSHNYGKTYSKNGGQTYQEFYSPPINSTRKLSLQNEDYIRQEMRNTPSDNYYANMSPEQQLMNNLPQVCQWSRDQNGSRAVQNVFQTGQECTKQLLFSFILKQHTTLMIDRFGNYVFQKIFQKGTEKQKKKLFDTIKGKIITLSEHCYGCRVVQKAVQYVQGNLHLEQELINEISHYTLRLIQSQNGNHVLQKCCQILQPSSLAKIAQKIIQNLKTLAFHAYGCRVIQKYLQNCRGQPSEQVILSELLLMTFDLSQCQYGNYVMQHIVLNCKQHKTKVLDVIYSNFAYLSFNKYASNVIQKAITTSGTQQVEKLAQLAIDCPQLIALSKHQFGNYVIQSLLQKMSKEKKLLLKSRLKQNSHEISKSQYGRHVLMQLQKFK